MTRRRIEIELSTDGVLRRRVRGGRPRAKAAAQPRLDPAQAPPPASTYAEVLARLERAQLRAQTEALLARQRRRRLRAGEPLHGSDGHFEAAKLIVENPLGPGGISAVVNVRELPAATLAARGVIDTIQQLAGERFAALYRLAGGGDLSAIDYCRQRGGGSGDLLPVCCADALQELHLLASFLGLRAYWLMVDVLVIGRTLADLGGPRQRRRLVVAEQVRCALDDLVEWFGLIARGPKKGKIRGWGLDSGAPK